MRPRNVVKRNCHHVTRCRLLRSQSSSHAPLGPGSMEESTLCPNHMLQRAVQEILVQQYAQAVWAVFVIVSTLLLALSAVLWRTVAKLWALEEAFRLIVSQPDGLDTFRRRNNGELRSLLPQRTSTVGSRTRSVQLNTRLKKSVDSSDPNRTNFNDGDLALQIVPLRTSSADSMPWVHSDEGLVQRRHSIAAPTRTSSAQSNTRRKHSLDSFVPLRTSSGGSVPRVHRNEGSVQRRHSASRDCMSRLHVDDGSRQRRHSNVFGAYKGRTEGSQSPEPRGKDNGKLSKQSCSSESRARRGKESGYSSSLILHIQPGSETQEKYDDDRNSMVSDSDVSESDLLPRRIDIHKTSGTGFGGPEKVVRHKSNDSPKNHVPRSGPGTSLAREHAIQAEHSQRPHSILTKRIDTKQSSGSTPTHKQTHAHTRTHTNTPLPPTRTHTHKHTHTNTQTYVGSRCD